LVLYVPNMMTLWNILSPFVGAGLTVIVFWFWKPWAAAYSEEKGKNLARKEDLDAIVAEMRAVTIAQKEIEHKLSDALWNRQVQWNQKKEIYSELLAASNDISSACALIPRLKELDAKAPSQQHTGPIATAFSEALNKIHASSRRLSKNSARARIFASEECVSAIDTYHIAFNSSEEIGSIEWAKAAGQAAVNLERALTIAAKHELVIRD
jgi:hypothetical protein